MFLNLSDQLHFPFLGRGGEKGGYLVRDPFQIDPPGEIGQLTRLKTCPVQEIVQQFGQVFAGGLDLSREFPDFLRREGFGMFHQETAEVTDTGQGGSQVMRNDGEESVFSLVCFVE